MKNQVIIPALAIFALVVGVALHAETKSGVEKRLIWAKNYIKEEDKKLLIPQVNKPLEWWEKEFAVAKTFVVDNSRNLLGTEDVDIIKALGSAEKASSDIIGIIKIFRELKPGSELKLQIDRVRELKQELKISMDTLNDTSMILPNKKEAKEIVLLMGKLLDDIMFIVSNWYWDIDIK